MKNNNLNLLIMTSDQQRWDCIGALNSLVPTLYQSLSASKKYHSFEQHIVSFNSSESDMTTRFLLEPLRVKLYLSKHLIISC